MNKKIKFRSNKWYSKEELEALLEVLDQQESTDKNPKGNHTYTIYNSVITYKIDDEGDVIVYDKKD